MRMEHVHRSYIPTQRTLSLALIVLSALPWSLSLGVFGLWLIFGEHDGGLGEPAVRMSSGIAALCAGQIVFLLCIADRVFPRTHRVISRTLEGGLGAIFLGSVVVCAIASVMSWGG